MKHSFLLEESKKPKILEVLDTGTSVPVNTVYIHRTYTETLNVVKKNTEFEFFLIFFPKHVIHVKNFKQKIKSSFADDDDFL